jgi:hypothetical protein
MKMSIEHWWDDTDRGKLKYLEENLVHFQFFNYKSRTDCTGIEQGLLQ